MTPHEVVTIISRTDITGPLNDLGIKFNFKPMGDDSYGNAEGIFKMRIAFRVGDREPNEFYNEQTMIVNHLDTAEEVAEKLRAVFMEWAYNAFNLSLLYRGKKKLLAGQ